MTFSVRQINASISQHHIDALSAVLIDTVASGGSISFMHPVSPETAQLFWHGIARGVANGQRVLLVAENDRAEIVGTVQVVLAQPENQPHRGDLAKLMVHSKARNQGIAAALVREAVAVAQRARKTLLTLDTETGGTAERLYTRLGWTASGSIPNYALLPHGGYCSTTIFYLAIG